MDFLCSSLVLHYPFDKIGCVLVIKKNQAFFVLLSACTIFAL